MHFNIFLDISWLFVQMVSQNTGVMVIMALGWGLAMVFTLGRGERKKRPVSFVRQQGYILFTDAWHLQSLVSHHHLYSWGIDVSLALQQCFVTFGFTTFKLKSLALCSLSKTASLSIYFCLPHPVWISFVNLYLTTLVFQELASVSQSTLLAQLH